MAWVSWPCLHRMPTETFTTERRPEGAVGTCRTVRFHSVANNGMINTKEAAPKFVLHQAATLREFSKFSAIKPQWSISIKTLLLLHFQTFHSILLFQNSAGIFFSDSNLKPFQPLTKMLELLNFLEIHINCCFFKTIFEKKRRLKNWLSFNFYLTKN